MTATSGSRARSQPSAMGDCAALAVGADPSLLTPLGWLIFTALVALAAPLGRRRADL